MSGSKSGRKMLCNWIKNIKKVGSKKNPLEIFKTEQEVRWWHLKYTKYLDISLSDLTDWVWQKMHPNLLSGSGSFGGVGSTVVVRWTAG